MKLKEVRKVNMERVLTVEEMAKVEETAKVKETDKIRIRTAEDLNANAIKTAKILQLLPTLPNQAKAG